MRSRRSRRTNATRSHAISSAAPTAPGSPPRSHAYGKIHPRPDSTDAVAFVNRLPQPARALRYLLWIRGRRTTIRAGVFSLHNGFGYLIFHHNPQTRVTDAFVTLQHPSST